MLRYPINAKRDKGKLRNINKFINVSQFVT